jgi:hypothetical protein
MRNQQRNTFVTKPNYTLYNHFTNESLTGDLINEDDIEGKKFYVMRINGRVLKFAKDSYSPKRLLLNR